MTKIDTLVDHHFLGEVRAGRLPRKGRRVVRDWADRVRDWCAATRFVGLSILESPSPVGDHGLVAFAATLSQDGVESVLRERSAFHRRDGAWFYHSGAAL